MSEARSLAVQSVLFGNSSQDIARAAEAVANSARDTVSMGLVTDWHYLLGDCSEEPVFGDAELAELRETVEGMGGHVTYEFFGENLGSAAGHNRLATRSDSELLVILNPDAVVAPDTIGVLVSTLCGDVAIVEARQIPLEHPKEYSAETGETSWASTACAITSRTVFAQVGGFDAKTFFLYCDDVDYSWRVRLAGFRVVYSPAARVFHDKRLTTSGDWPASSAEVYFSAEAAILLAAKYSRPDLVASLVTQYESEGGAPAKAAEEYLQRRAAGELPSPLDPDHLVSEFIAGNYTTHRF